MSPVDAPVLVSVEVNVATAAGAGKESVSQNCPRAVEWVSVVVKPAVKKYYKTHF